MTGSVDVDEIMQRFREGLPQLLPTMILEGIQGIRKAIEDEPPDGADPEDIELMQLVLDGVLETINNTITIYARLGEESTLQAIRSLIEGKPKEEAVELIRTFGSGLAAQVLLSPDFKGGEK